VRYDRFARPAEDKTNPEIAWLFRAARQFAAFGLVRRNSGAAPNHLTGAEYGRNSSCLSNALVEQKETVAVEDKYRIEQHGFDSKSSFRKEKRR
jgi:hypothetical protein